jgi:transcriptional repressor NrdR
MKCPECGHEEDKVVDSRPHQNGRAVRRRRECAKCAKRYTTYEYIEAGSLTVLKTDDRREPFDRNKLLHGIKLACNKRPVTSFELDNMVTEIESELHAKGKSEVPSPNIGEIVMAKLKVVDEIAYVRFASVYRKFADTAEFLEEMKRILEK